jgi:3-deoxy-D-manno-octulosonic acid kinase
MAEVQLTKNDRLYRIGFSGNLGMDQLEELLPHLRTPKTAEGSIAGGRAAVTTATIEGVGSVVIKPYMRGGIIRHILKSRYVKFGKPRSQVEFESMSELRRLGIRAPEPLAYAYRGFPLYCAWLVTREVENACTLAELDCADISRVTGIMGKVIEQIDRLVACGFIHVDLHPGNVLVDSHDRIYLIDFDKGRRSTIPKNRLYDVYYRRWRRAVVKHQLPEILDEILLEGLEVVPKQKEN